MSQSTNKITSHKGLIQCERMETIRAEGAIFIVEALKFHKVTLGRDFEELRAGEKFNCVIYNITDSTMTFESQAGASTVHYVYEICPWGGKKPRLMNIMYPA